MYGPGVAPEENGLGAATAATPLSVPEPACAWLGTSPQIATAESVRFVRRHRAGS